MDHRYARDKLTTLLRDLDRYTADEFWRQMSRIAAGATGADHAEELAKKLNLTPVNESKLSESRGPQNK